MRLRRSPRGSLATLVHPLDEGERDRVVRDPAGEFAVEVLPDHAAVVLRLIGSLDLGSVPTLSACLDQIDPEFQVVALDLADLRFIDSTGIGTLVQARRALAVDLRTLIVRNPSERARFVLELTGLGDLIEDPAAAAD